MNNFLGEDFLLTTDTARRLYHSFAEPQPIFDYHTHLSAEDIAANRRFTDLYEIWLAGDHYKWRAMRANGIDERYCTGKADNYEKFQAWATTVPSTLRNPLYAWTHLELRRYFEIEELLDAQTAPRIWAAANEVLQQGLTTQAILKKFRVEVICTTDDPATDLRHHRELALSHVPFRVLPTFRPDRALAVNDTHAFCHFVQQLGEAAGMEIRDFATFLEALQARHNDFHRHGCRLSDHGLEHCYAAPCSESEASRIFQQALGGSNVAPDEHEDFASFLMLYFGKLDAGAGWTKQLHLGAARNVNSRAFRALGPDTGFDTMGDALQGSSLAGYLDLLAREDASPRMVLYNSNPRDNDLFATLAGSFQDGNMPGKIQYGSAWWFLDQRHGITGQLEALSNAGLLSRFVGMVTDSRSFMSFPRHEYFRRVLCDWLAESVRRGELPEDDRLLGRLVSDVCYANANRYFQLPSQQDVRESLVTETAKPRSV